MATPAELDKVRKLREAAAEMVTKGKHANAMAAYIDILKITPGDATVRQKLAETLGRAGRKNEAIEQYRHLAGKYASEGHLLKAIAICSIILQLDPQHRDTQATLAELYSQRDASAPKTASLPAEMSGAIARDPNDLAQRYGSIGAKLIMPKEAPAASPPAAPSSRPIAALPIQSSMPRATEPASIAPPRSTPPPAPAKPILTSYTMPPLRGPAAVDAIEIAEDDGPYSADSPLPVDVDTLTRIPLFGDLERDAFIAVLERVQVRPVRAGDTIVREGDPGDSMYAIATGIVRVVREEGDTGKSKLLAELADGSFFGEMSLVVHGPRIATVLAATDVVLLEFSRSAVDQIVRKHPRVKEVILQFHKTRLLSNLLRSSPIFKSFNADEKKRLIESFHVRSFPPNTTILEQGQPGSGFFVLLRGKCEVIGTDATGAPGSIRYPTMGEGDVFGELSLMTDGLVSATVRTTTDCVVLGLHRKLFQELVLSNAEVRAAITELSQKRLQRTQELTEEFILEEDELIPASELL